MKNEWNKNTLQLLARKSYIHIYVPLAILPSPPPLFPVKPGFTHSHCIGIDLIFIRAWVNMCYVYILERCRDGCRTSLLIAGGCSVPLIFHTSLPSCHPYITIHFVEMIFPTCSTIFWRINRYIMIGSSYCIKPFIPLCTHCKIMHVYTWRHTSKHKYIIVQTIA